MEEKMCFIFSTERGYASGHPVGRNNGCVDVSYPSFQVIRRYSDGAALSSAGTGY
jgi:hypothetical protein